MPVTVFSKLSSSADPILARDQLTGLQALYKQYGLEYFCKQFIWILKKKPEKSTKQPKTVWNRRLVPFIWNRMQQDLHEKETRSLRCVRVA